jgi:cytochrome c-type biogenesis protein CcmH
MRFLLVTLVALMSASELSAQTSGAPVSSPAQSRVPDAAQFVGEPKGKPLAGEELIQRTHDVSALLRCPVCQGLAVNDSPAEMAVNMKGQVRELLARGYTEQQILDYFERSYGQFVLLKPKFQGINAFVWLLPMIALALGAFVVFSKLRKLEQPVQKTALPVVAAEDPYLAQVREMVGREK